MVALNLMALTQRQGLYLIKDKSKPIDLGFVLFLAVLKIEPKKHNDRDCI